MYLRNHGDANVLYDRLSSLPEGSNVVLMGGGYIGTEVGASVLGFKHKVRAHAGFGPNKVGLVSPPTPSKLLTSALHATEPTRPRLQLTIVEPSGKFVGALFTDRISKVYMDAFKKRGAEVRDAEHIEAPRPTAALCYSYSIGVHQTQRRLRLT